MRQLHADPGEEGEGGGPTRKGAYARLQGPCRQLTSPSHHILGLPWSGTAADGAYKHLKCTPDPGSLMLTAARRGESKNRVPASPFQIGSV